MSNRFLSLIAALSLVVCLSAPDADAALIVTATQASGQRGDNVDVTLSISSDGITTDEVDLAQISAYTFNFLWDAAVLNFNSYSSAPGLNASTLTTGPGSAVIDWLDGTFSTPVDFSSGLSITVEFQIKGDAAPGPSIILFGIDPVFSSLTQALDEDPFSKDFSFLDVTEGDQMQVTVLPTSQIPEPAGFSMVLAGLGILVLVARRRKIVQA